MKEYDSSQPASYLMYLDVNNLYGFAMCASIPLCGFEWIPPQNLGAVDKILKTSEDSQYGYVLEVDLEYPESIHDLHQSYPMCAEHKASPHSLTHNKKLLLTLENKQKYVIHYIMLKFVLSHGLKLTKVHRILKFVQSPWLKPYINLNTNERNKSTNEFSKNLFKLMSNCIYGKTMENIRDRVNIVLRTQWGGKYGVRTLIVNPRFKKCTIFTKNLVAIEMQKTSVQMMKPIIIGFTVLEISKLKMYDFHYNQMLPTFGFNCILNYTDTDSFIYSVFCNDLYKYIKQNLHLFDTSNYERNNVFAIARSEKKIGLMKDENGGRIMTEFVGLRAKMYSIRVDDIDSVKKAKGIKNYVIRQSITFDDYIACIRNSQSLIGSQNLIQSNLHKVFSLTQTKKILCPFDDKRQILSDGIKTLPWGHYSIK